MTPAPPPPGAEAVPDPAAETGPNDGRVDRRLLEFLVCPVTRGPLIFDAGRRELLSRNAGLAFPIVNGVPVMLVDEARRIDD